MNDSEDHQDFLVSKYGLTNMLMTECIFLQVKL